jgi:hypothetical protein
LTASKAGTLTCSTGLPNDLISFNTDNQQWKVIATTSLPSLAPGSNMSAQVTWTGSRLTPGFWPVSCEVKSSGDKYSANDSAQKVFRVTRRR